MLTACTLSNGLSLILLQGQKTSFWQCIRPAAQVCECLCTGTCRVHCFGVHEHQGAVPEQAPCFTLEIAICRARQRPQVWILSP